MPRYHRRMDLSAEDAYLFRHAIIRDAAYQLQLPSQRARLHGLAVECLEAWLDGIGFAWRC